MISIIIPVYNAACTLQRCVQSVVDQTFPELEILLVNDGSTDSSASLCDEWAVRDRRIRVFHQSNGGVSSARNTGIQQSTGDYLLMLDSDDFLDLNACQKLMDYEELSGADCIVFGFSYGGGAILNPSRAFLYDSLSSFKKDFLHYLNEGLLSSSCNKLYKRRLLKEGYLKHLSFGEDLVFVLNYLSHCQKIQFIPHTLYNYDDVSNEQSLSRGFRKETIWDIEYYQKEVIRFSGLASPVPLLFAKYRDDCLNYIRGLYCSRAIAFAEKKHLLQSWFSQSYFQSIHWGYSGSLFYKCLNFFVSRQWWTLPQYMLYFLRILHIRKNLGI